MAEDDVERLVARVTQTNVGLLLPVDGESVGAGEVRDVAILCSGSDVLRLARIVRELLAFLPAEPCEYGDDAATVCRDGYDPEDAMCDPCRARALRERLNAIARGEEA